MFMMPSLSWVGWTFFCLLFWRRMLGRSAELHCSVAPVGALHPVQGLLERFEAGSGCAAREPGNKETHVIAVGRVTNSPENKVTVLLRPMSLSPSPLRAVHLLLSSRLPVSWWLEAERLPPNLPVLVQVSSNSSVHSDTLNLNVQILHSIPYHPSALHHWALKHYGNLSSLTHTSHANRVYIPLGEDHTLPAVCELQSMFLSRNYMTSDLQPQEVHGCTDTPAGGISPEVHVIKLHSAGSALCGSLQVEVIVSLVPLVANAKFQKIVLILSSSVSVNWAIVAHGVRGHISVHSSNTVSPPSPPEPALTLFSNVNSGLSTIPDLIGWARDSGYTMVTSYTEADLANRFVIRLAGGGTEAVTVMNPLVVRPPWAEERKLRQWLTGGTAGGIRESFTVQCEDGRLSVIVDQHILKSLSIPVAAVTLQDSTCQAQSNGSHFLLVFPVISCGTEGLLLGQPKGVQYKNMANVETWAQIVAMNDPIEFTFVSHSHYFHQLLLWRDEPGTIMALSETEIKPKNPLGIHFSCLAAIPTLPAFADDVDVNTPPAGLVPWVPRSPLPVPGLSRLPTPRHRSGPVLILKLFVNENYEETRIGPCVITADHRVYVEISAKGSSIDVLEVKSCVVSPLSDPKKSRFWTVLRDGCSSDPSLTLGEKTTDEEEEETRSEGEPEEEDEKLEEQERGSDGEARYLDSVERNGREEAPKWMEKIQEEEEIWPLRFSFIMRPVFNDSMQFLHCSLHMCMSDSKTGEHAKETVEKDCKDGIHIPPLVYGSPRQKCEIRNLSRPMVITQSISSLAPKMLRPPAGQRTKRLSVSPLDSPDPEHSSSVVQTGPVIGIVFAAFAMGVSLMGGLWCIYYYTGTRPALLGAESHLTDPTHETSNIWNPLSLSDQSSSSV